MIQEGGLFPHLTIRDNVAIVPQYLGWPRSDIDQRIDELRQLAQLPEAFLNRYPRQFVWRSAATCQLDARPDARPRCVAAR